MRPVKKRNRKEISMERIKKIRTNAKLTQEQFAEKLELSTNTISRIENGITELSAEVALKINSQFYVSLDYLFGLGTDEEGEPPCSFTCDELINAQNLIKIQEITIQELCEKIDAIKRILDGSNTLQLKK